MKKWILIVLLPLLVLACKSKKKALSGEEPVSAKDFIEYFDEVKPPFTVADSSFQPKKSDTAAISYKTFTGIVPDTLLHSLFGKTTRPRIWPMGKITAKGKETYLLVKATSAAAKAAYVLVFNKDNKFVTGMPLIVLDNNPGTEQTAFIDNKYSITTNRQTHTADGRLLYRKAAYAYISSADAFALILTESNETETKKELLNPIDTLPRKNKLSGDYLQNKLNIVSVRDSKKTGELLIFVHFEKDAGSCKGELKGAAKIKSPNKLFYHQPGDQCELTLDFSGNTVTLKEDGCGSHRDIKCFFEGSFVRKPAARTSAKPAKSIKPAKKV